MWNREQWREWYEGSYLKTDHWHKVKQVVYRRNGGRCERCDRHDIEHVHHVHYFSLWHELDDPTSVTGLCRLPCLSAWQVFPRSCGGGADLSPGNAPARLRSLRSACGPRTRRHPDVQELLCQDNVARRVTVICPGRLEVLPGVGRWVQHRTCRRRAAVVQELPRRDDGRHAPPLRGHQHDRGGSWAWDRNEASPRS